MTGPEDLVSGLDDPAGVPARLPAIDGVVNRGRRLRARRYAVATGSAAILSTAVVVAAFGVVPGINAARTDNGITPATQPPASATPSASNAPHKHGGTQVLVVPRGDGRRAEPTHAPSPLPTTVPIVDPCASPSPTAVDPSATSEPTPAATGAGSTDSCTSPSPEPSATPTDSESPTPADSPVDSATPAA